MVRQSRQVLAGSARGGIGIQLALQVSGRRQVRVELQYLRDGGASSFHFSSGAIEQREIHSHFAPARNAIKRTLPKFYGAIGIASLRFNGAEIQCWLVRQRINFQGAKVMLARLFGEPALLFLVAQSHKHARVIRRFHSTALCSH